MCCIGSNGHVWILATNAYADVYYQNAIALANNTFNLTSDYLHTYVLHLGFELPAFADNISNIADVWDTTYANDSNFRMAIKNDLISALITLGDGQLFRLRYHISDGYQNFHMSEQICETTGLPVGANDLTWSYATFLSAMNSRDIITSAPFSFTHRPLEIPMNDSIIANAIAARAVKYGTAPQAGCFGQC